MARFLHHPVCVYVVRWQATGYASQHIWCLSQARINWEGCGRKGIRRKNGADGGGSLISLDGVAPIWNVRVSAFALHHKVQKIFSWHWLNWVVLEEGP